MTTPEDVNSPARGACHDFQRTIADLRTINASGLFFSTAVHDRHSQLQGIIQKKDQSGTNIFHESTGIPR